MNSIKSIAFLSGYSKEASPHGLMPPTNTPSNTNPIGDAYSYVKDKAYGAAGDIASGIAGKTMDSLSANADDPDSIAGKLKSKFLTPVENKVKSGMTAMAGANAAGQLGVGLMRNMSDNARHTEMMGALNRMGTAQARHKAPARPFRLSQQTTARSPYSG